MVNHAGLFPHGHSCAAQCLRRYAVTHRARPILQACVTFFASTAPARRCVRGGHRTTRAALQPSSQFRATGQPSSRRITVCATGSACALSCFAAGLAAGYVRYLSPRNRIPLGLLLASCWRWRAKLLAADFLWPAYDRRYGRRCYLRAGDPHLSGLFE